MKTYESFRSDWEHEEYLRKHNRHGKLEAETVDAIDREVMLEKALTTDPAPGVYLEIGPSHSPYFPDSSRVFSEAVQYVGLDGGKSRYYGNDGPFPLDIRGWTERGGRYAHMFMDKAARDIAADDKAEFASLIWGDAQQLPFPDRDKNVNFPIRETFMRDVLMAPGVHVQSMERIFKEQARVLTTDGQLIVRETSFHQYHDLSSAEGNLSPRFLAMLASLENAGFRKRILAFDTTPQFDRLNAQFPPEEGAMIIGYYLICEQGEASISEPRNLLGKIATALRLTRSS